jgi:EAL domain-containing protein (putative c-di-GMP-specific phosphodiesterase class I)
VHYQPLVDVATARVVSLEALVRWPHPRAGSIAPGEFIPVAEESGLIIPLGELVLRTVCNQVVRWQQENVPVVPVAVNLSGVQFERLRLWEYIRRILRETGMPPHLLALEITESALMKDPERHAGALQGLRSDGVRILIDDFGTGYSSLSYLRHLPIDTLKIDRSFISHIDTNSSDEAIVSTILAMSRTLELRVVAEGVETAAQLQVLAKHGCETAQGFYFSHPLPAAQCRDLLIEVASRASFSDTLRMRVATRRAAGPPPTEAEHAGSAQQPGSRAGRR